MALDYTTPCLPEECEVTFLKDFAIYTAKNKRIGTVMAYDVDEALQIFNLESPLAKHMEGLRAEELDA